MLLYFFSTIDSYVVYHLYVDHGTRYSFSYYWIFFHTFNLIKLMLSFISSNGYTNSMSYIHLLYQFHPLKNFHKPLCRFQGLPISRQHPFRNSLSSLCHSWPTLFIFLNTFPFLLTSNDVNFYLRQWLYLPKSHACWSVFMVIFNFVAHNIHYFKNVHKFHTLLSVFAGFTFSFDSNTLHLHH